MNKILMFVMIFSVAFVFDADAAIKTKNHSNNAARSVFVAEDGSDLDDAETIAILEEDIRILDEEIAKCKKQKKGWIAATVIGAAGVVATGTAAAVQGAKIGQKKDTYTTKQSELKSLKDEKKEVQKELTDFESQNN